MSTMWLFNVLVSLAAASLLLLLAASAAVILTRQPARRIRVIELALAGLAVLPLLGLLPSYPRWSLAGALTWASPERVNAPPATIAVPADPAPQPWPSTDRSPTRDAGTAGVAPRKAAFPYGDIRNWMLRGYLLGAGAMVAWSLLGWFAVGRVLRAARPAPDGCRDVLRGVSGPAGESVRLVVSPHVSQPCAVGWRKATIILPSEFCAAADARQLQWALAHEWSHIERGDLRSWTASGLVSWIYYWQPLYWLLRRQLHVCQDFVADAAAASRPEMAEDYAEFLTHSAVRAPRPALAAGLGFGGRVSDLHRRVMMLVGRRLPLENVAPKWWNLLAVPLAIVLVGTAAMLVEGPIRSAAAQTKSQGSKATGNRLSYHDNTAEGKRSIGGSGEMISFSLPDEKAKISSIRIHGSRYGYPKPPKEDFMIYFLNGDMSETVATKTAPYARFKRGPQGWVTIRFPKPVEVPKDFWICLDFRAERTKGVYVSIDESSDGSHSRVGLPGTESREADVGGDWMIEAILAK